MRSRRCGGRRLRPCRRRDASARTEPPSSPTAVPMVCVSSWTRHLHLDAGAASCTASTSLTATSRPMRGTGNGWPVLDRRWRRGFRVMSPILQAAAPGSGEGDYVARWGAVRRSSTTLSNASALSTATGGRGRRRAACGSTFRRSSRPRSSASSGRAGAGHRLAVEPRQRHRRDRGRVRGGDVVERAEPPSRQRAAESARGLQCPAAGPPIRRSESHGERRVRYARAPPAPGGRPRTVRLTRLKSAGAPTYRPGRCGR